MANFILGFILIILFGVSLWIKAIPWILIGFIIVRCNKYNNIK